MDPSIPSGFEMAGVHCGIKDDPQREDLTVIRCLTPAVGVGVYTRNRFFAAPVAWDKSLTPSEQIRAVVVNSGNANACTGQRGEDDAQEMARVTAEACGVEPTQVLVMSTGIIGRFLPMPRVVAGIQAAAGKLGTDTEALSAAARGMLTTDKGPKVAGRTIDLDSGPAQLLGLAKGAAMIGPKMATMLAVFMTDARLTVADAQETLERSVDASFHCISVEGHTSTNDTVLLLSSGTRPGPPLSGTELKTLQDAVQETAVELARMIPDDGEGSSHLIEIEVAGCESRDDAFQIAKTVAESALVKTAITGGDPNWGRIVSAAGYAGVDFDPRKVDLIINGHDLFKSGSPLPFDERLVSESICGRRTTTIRLQFGEGSSEVTFWTSDLTVDYVRFNAEYST